ncbi:EexN family lipoprotein [Vibrio parahaemolyticus]|uniref:EexN family lipoprotein n=1 Tax=Vibrio TaxID=662 RepID=UPI0010D715B4|nr:MULTISPECIES: EexN family lipoprotein [Vibrio]EKK7180265.1 EexN family lipoprotein [Vibrio alginolyticus]EGQ9055244.1 hypothetical protein [Vibrio parahaemolyticus]ELB2083771.1 EexN family lipoprotein [Vibrio parahaemolyticus]MBE3744966.1 EexN family lipoprotein [Vibrio parahaemolyticus]MDF5393459.1 EexN family lipoprotein [Vibrio parahaemolyticus]
MKHLTLATILIFFLSGCFSSEEQTHDVAWFKSHEKERRSILNKCINNPGELKDNSNCLNAKQAERELTTGQLPTLKFDK